jgi:hypothetical protein
MKLPITGTSFMRNGEMPNLLIENDQRTRETQVAKMRKTK